MLESRPAKNPPDVTTTRGDMIVRGVSADERLAIGAAARYIRSDGTNPSWAQVQAGDITGAPWSNILAPTTTQTVGAAVATIATIASITNKGHSLDLTVVATRDDRSGMVTFKLTCTVTNAGGTLTVCDLIITPSDGGLSGVTVDVMEAGTDILIKVTGVGGATYDWVCAGTTLVHGS